MINTGMPPTLVEFIVQHFGLGWEKGMSEQVKRHGGRLSTASLQKWVIPPTRQESPMWLTLE